LIFGCLAGIKNRYINTNIFLVYGIKDAFVRKVELLIEIINGARLCKASLPSGLKAAQGTHSAQIHKKLCPGSRARWGYVHGLFSTIMAEVCQTAVLMTLGKRHNLLFVHNL
jgi:hypothetical protein